MKNRLFIALQYCLPQHLLSRVAGRLANCEIPLIKNFLINRFIAHFRVVMEEAREPRAERYKNFNAFFTRALKTGARPFDPSTETLCSPADGEISQIGRVQEQLLFQAKEHYFSLEALLGNNTALAAQFNNGEFATIYLSPKDYHRVHMPCDAKLVNATYVPGKLFSVNHTTAESVPELFARNERLICEFETKQGRMVMILVGAMIVAAIETIWRDYSQQTPKAIESERLNSDFCKGDELGRFKLGSTVILLFQKEKICWQSGIESTSPLRMGENIASVL